MIHTSKESKVIKERKMFNLLFEFSSENKRVFLLFLPALFSLILVIILLHLVSTEGTSLVNPSNWSSVGHNSSYELPTYYSLLLSTACFVLLNTFVFLNQTPASKDNGAFSNPNIFTMLSILATVIWIITILFVEHGRFQHFHEKIVLFIFVLFSIIDYMLWNISKKNIISIENDILNRTKRIKSYNDGSDSYPEAELNELKSELSGFNDKKREAQNESEWGMAQLWLIDIPVCIGLLVMLGFSIIWSDNLKKSEIIVSDIAVEGTWGKCIPGDEEHINCKKKSVKKAILNCSNSALQKRESCLELFNGIETGAALMLGNLFEVGLSGGAIVMHLAYSQVVFVILALWFKYKLWKTNRSGTELA